MQSEARTNQRHALESSPSYPKRQRCPARTSSYPGVLRNSRAARKPWMFRQNPLFDGTLGPERRGPAAECNVQYRYGEKHPTAVVGEKRWRYSTLKTQASSSKVPLHDDSRYECIVPRGHAVLSRSEPGQERRKFCFLPGTTAADRHKSRYAML